jgi:hypothetical protein
VKVGNLVRMKEEPFPITRPYGLGLVLRVVNAAGYNCAILFPDLIHSNFDGVKWCNWQNTLEVISESR